MTEPVFPEHFSEETSIQFFSEDTDFAYRWETEIYPWIIKVIENQNCHLQSELNFIFCSDDYLHQLNVDYLDHDTLTDIITFPYTQAPAISGDIFISVDRVRENAQQYQTSFLTELHRVIIHGVLHLCGYRDKTAAEQERMRAQEDGALQLLSELNIL